jgi:hypothetical protein
MRRRSPLAPWVSLGCALLLQLHSGSALAKPSKETAVCIDNFERSQEHRRDQRLLQARTELLLCAASSCPAAIQKPCNKWLSEVAKELPTIVLRVESNEGATLSTARANLDGEASTKALGVPIELDPGQHTVRIRDASGEETSLSITVQPGEKDKMVVVRLPPKPVEPATSAPAPAAVSPALPPRRGLTAGPIALFSTSLVATGVFAVLGSQARSQANELRDRCAPTCPHDQVDPIRRKALVADVALGVGVVSFGLGLWAALTRPAPAQTTSSLSNLPASAPRWFPTVGVGPGGATLGTSLTF